MFALSLLNEILSKIRSLNLSVDPKHMVQLVINKIQRFVVLGLNVNLRSKGTQRN
jgi:hypothetical protein